MVCRPVSENRQAGRQAGRLRWPPRPITPRTEIGILEIRLLISFGGPDGALATPSCMSAGVGIFLPRPWNSLETMAARGARCLRRRLRTPAVARHARRHFTAIETSDIRPVISYSWPRDPPTRIFRFRSPDRPFNRERAIDFSSSLRSK